MKFLTSLDLTGNKLLNVRLQSLASGTGITAPGSIFYNSATGRVNYRNGTSIVALATADDIASAGGGDMTKAVYDTTNNGIVDVAETVPWSGVTSKPETFAPSAHTHLASEVTDLTTAVNALIVAYVDTTAGSDADLDTLRELIDVVKANRTALGAVVKRYQTLVGGATSIAVEHALNTRDVIVQVYDAATYAEVLTDVVRTTADVVTVSFATAPAANAYRVVVLA